MAARKPKEKSPGPRSATDLHKSLGEKVRAARLAANISQDELGKALGLSFQQIQKYEKGVNRIEMTRMIAIAKFLNAPLADFIGAVEIKRTQRRQDFDAVLATREGAQVIEAMITMSEGQRQFMVEIARRLPQLTSAA